ncbi:MAG: dolichyl-phosphate beta-glucosyltransferase [bacterium]
MYLSVIIPCHNEEKRICNTIQRIYSYLKTQAYNFEIIVVENGSTDSTKKILEQLSYISPMRIVYENKPGKGRAIKRGMREAVGEYKLFTDADNSTDIHHIEKLLPYTQQGYDIVISSRKTKDSVIKKQQPPLRRLLGNVFIMFVKIVIPLGLHDTQNGFKLFSKKAADKIFPNQTILDWAFDVEVLALARLLDFSIVEVPITWVNDELSKMTTRGMLRMAWDILCIRWNLLTKYYTRRL